MASGAVHPRRWIVADAWRAVVAASLEWEQAHVSFDRAVAGLPEGERGRRAHGLPHSVWELVEHIRIAQADLLAFMTDPAYREPRWPDDYWPAGAEPPSPGAWEESLVAVRRDRAALARLAVREDLDLMAEIPNGDGKTYLRTLLVAADHAAYHVGQIVLVRRACGVWGP